MPLDKASATRSPLSLTASARAIRLDDRSTKPRKVRAWQKQAWELYDNLAELKPAANYVANQIAKAELYVGRIIGKHVEPATDARAVEVLERLRHNGTFASIIKPLCLNLDIAGEAFLFGRGSGGVSGSDMSWKIHSTEELTVTDRQYKLREDPDGIGGGETFTDETAYVARIWSEHPRFCVDEQTEILTTRGWVKHNGLNNSDMVLTLNHLTGLSEWQQVQNIYRERVTDEKMVGLETKAISVLTTKDHRWPVLQKKRVTFTQNGRKTSRLIGRERVWTTANLLNSNHSIIGASPCADLPNEPKWSDSFVELAAWFWTEGHIVRPRRTDIRRVHDVLIDREGWKTWVTSRRKELGLTLRDIGKLPGYEGDIVQRGVVQRGADIQRSGVRSHKNRVALAHILQVAPDEMDRFYTPGNLTSHVTISQSHGVNPQNVLRIRAALTDLFGSPTLSRMTTGDIPTTPMWREFREKNRLLTSFVLNAAAAELLLEIAPNRVVSPAFILQLTKAQLHLFVETSIDADGSRTGEQRIITQSDPERLNAIELASILLGYSPKRFAPREDKHFGGTTWVLNIKQQPFRETVGLHRTNYSGIVWCPQTTNQTWLARRNGTIFFTGNSSWPDSPMRSLLGVCTEIERIELAKRAIARSRSAGAGILLVPTELTTGGFDPTQDTSEEGDPFNRELIANMTTPIQDEGSAAAVVPLVLRGDKEALAAVRRVELNFEINPALLNLDEALIRFARGFNLPVESMQGSGGVNHWSLWKIGEVEFTAYFEPRLQTLCEGLTAAYLRPNLGGDSDLLIWYDPSAIIRRPNMDESADKGLEEIVLSESAWRERKGYRQDEAPDDEERARRLTLKAGRLDGPTTESILNQLFDIKLEIQAIRNANPPAQRANPAEGEPGQTAPRPSESQPAGPPPQDRPANPGPPSRTASARLFLVSAASIDVGSELLSIDLHLRDRLLTASDAAVHRMIERAGTRIGTHFNKLAESSRIKGVPREKVAAILGRDAVAALNLTTDELFNGNMDTFTRQVDSWMSAASDSAIRYLPNLSSHDDLRTDLAISRAESISWLIGALLSLAQDRLYDPSPTPPDFGEWDGSLSVPPQIIREAMARAGGDNPEHVGMGLQIQGAAVGGLATGALILGALVGAGAELSGHEWAYGSTPRKREFEPHRRLDHKMFRVWDDDALANTDDSWLSTNTYYPGDHLGCLCDARPVILMPQQAVA